MKFTYKFQSRETVELIGAKVNSASICQLVDSDYAFELQNAFISGRKFYPSKFEILHKIQEKVFENFDPTDLHGVGPNRPPYNN